ncbi:MAG: hypothetical protein WDA75_22875 [Candidatus Latescibacterota bacterium]|jgi:hypothetical protein
MPEVVSGIFTLILGAVITLLCSLVMFYLKDLRDRTRQAHDKASGVKADLAAFKTKVAEKYVTRDELAAGLSRIENDLGGRMELLLCELREMRKAVGTVQESVAALNEARKA